MKSRKSQANKIEHENIDPGSVMDEESEDNDIFYKSREGSAARKNN